MSTLSTIEVGLADDLDLALRVGKAVGLDRQDSPLASINEPERSHWLRVWDSLRFLHS